MKFSEYLEFIKGGQVETLKDNLVIKKEEFGKDLMYNLAQKRTPPNIIKTDENAFL